MADTALTKEQGLALLTKLATDDAFRAHYEHKPAHALFDLGVPPDVIARLPGKCLCQRKLASKQAMQEARSRLESTQDTSLLQFVVPSPDLNR